MQASTNLAKLSDLALSLAAALPAGASDIIVAPVTSDGQSVIATNNPGPDSNNSAEALGGESSFGVGGSATADTGTFSSGPLGAPSTSNAAAYGGRGGHGGAGGSATANAITVVNNPFGASSTSFARSGWGGDVGPWGGGWQCFGWC